MRLEIPRDVLWKQIWMNSYQYIMKANYTEYLNMIFRL